MTSPSPRAGAAAIDITPAVDNTMLSGSLTRRYATGVLSPLHARVVVIENGGLPETGGTRLVFVLLDLIILGEEDSDPLRNQIGELAGVSPENVCVSCTHTHTGPGTIMLFDTERDAPYLEMAKARILEAVQQALDKLQPAQVAWGNGSEGRPQYNRRFHMRDGSVKFNPGKGNPNIVRVAGPTDPDIPMLLVRSIAGAPIAVIANYSLHYVGDFNSGLISSDYFGQFASIMRERKGDDFVALLTHGASGDINNINPTQAPTPWYPESIQPTERGKIVASMIANQVDSVWEKAEWHEVVKVGATQDIQMVGVRKIAGAEIEQAQREWEDESLDEVSRFYARERLEILKWPDSLPKVVQSFRVGGWAASTMTGEMFCQFGLDLKHASPFGTTALIEIANGYGGYMPNMFNYELGGYETVLARSAYARPGTGEAMVALAAAQLRRLWRLHASSETG